MISQTLHFLALMVLSSSVNVVVPPTDVLPTALDLASQIIANSPDSVQSTKKGLLLTYKHNNESMVWEHVRTPESAGYMLGDNIKVCFLSSLFRNVIMSCLYFVTGGTEGVQRGSWIDLFVEVVD
jgi:hypothetical protein